MRVAVSSHRYSVKVHRSVRRSRPSAAPPANAAPGTAAAAPATGAAPLSPQALNAANVPIKSEKLGTAAPSEDVKRGPTKSVPKGAAPATDREGTPATANKK